MSPITSASTYHSQQQVHIDIRPKRAAYLVHPASERHLRTAIRHASSRWGGIQELIIPTTAGGRIDPGYAQMLETAPPDAVYSVLRLSPNGRRRILNTVGVAPQPIADELRPHSGTHILGILSEAERSTPLTAAMNGDTTMEHVALGAFADFNRRDSWAHALSGSDSIAGVASEQFNQKSLIHTTETRCSLISTHNVIAARLLWVVDEPTLEELRWVWNLRALASISGGILAIVELSDTRSQDFKGEVHHWLRSLRWQSEPNLIISSWSVRKPLLVGLRSRLGLKTHKGESLSRHFGHSEEPKLSAGITRDPRAILMGKTTIGTRTTLSTTLARPSSTLRLDNPLAFQRTGGHVRMRVSGPDFLNVPRRHQTACLFIRNGRWQANELEFETTLSQRYEIDLAIPNLEDVLKATLANEGYAYAVSPPGQLGEVIFNRLADDAFSGLADSAAISMIRVMTTPRAKKIAQELSELDSRFDEPELEVTVAGLLGAPSRRASHTLGDIAGQLSLRTRDLTEQLAPLVKSGLVTRGLHIQCATCTLETFVDLHETEGNPSCPACGAAVSYSTNSSGTEPGFRYRLDPLLDRASDQGVLSHLFGMVQLRLTHPNLYAVPGVIVTRVDSDWTHEVDLVGFSGQEVFVGEAKYSSAEFTPTQIKRDVALGAALKATVQIMISLEALAQEQVDMFREECERAGLRPLILQPSESDHVQSE